MRTHDGPVVLLALLFSVAALTLALADPTITGFAHKAGFVSWLCSKGFIAGCGPLASSGPSSPASSVFTLAPTSRMVTIAGTTGWSVWTRIADTCVVKPSGCIDYPGGAGTTATACNRCISGCCVAYDCRTDGLYEAKSPPGCSGTGLGACTDSDYGIAIGTKGTVTYPSAAVAITSTLAAATSGGTTSLDDVCVDENGVPQEMSKIIREYYCVGDTAEYIDIDCTSAGYRLCADPAGPDACVNVKGSPPPANPNCGNGNLEGGEQCDPGIAQGQPGNACPGNTPCTPNCQCTPVQCGNAQLDIGEQCDVGAAYGTPANSCPSGDPCQADCTCTLPPLVQLTYCGDGQVDSPNDFGDNEECDDAEDPTNPSCNINEQCKNCVCERISESGAQPFRCESGIACAYTSQGMQQCLQQSQALAAQTGIPNTIDCIQGCCVITPR